MTGTKERAVGAILTRIAIWLAAKRKNSYLLREADSLILNQKEGIFDSWRQPTLSVTSEAFL